MHGKRYQPFLPANHRLLRLDNQWINPVPVAQVSREKNNSSGLLHHAGKKRRDHSTGTGATYYCRMRHPRNHHP